METHGRKLTGPKMTKQFQENRILEARATPLQGPEGHSFILPLAGVAGFHLQHLQIAHKSA